MATLRAPAPVIRELPEREGPVGTHQRRQRLSLITTGFWAVLCLIFSVTLWALPGAEPVAVICLALFPFLAVPFPLHRVGLTKAAELIPEVAGLVGVVCATLAMGTASHLHYYFMFLVARRVLLIDTAHRCWYDAPLIALPLATFAATVSFFGDEPLAVVPAETIATLALINEVSALLGLVVLVVVFRHQTYRAEDGLHEALNVADNENQRRRATECELERRNAFLNAVVSNVRAAVLTFDGKGRLTSANPAAAKVFRRTMEPTRAIRFAELFEDSEELSGKTLPTEVTGRRADGDRFPAEMKQSAFLVDGETMFTVVLRDLQPERQQEAALASANQENTVLARRAGMAEVATSVLHNIGNVLTSVETSAHLSEDALRSARVADVGRIALLLDAQAEQAGFFAPDGKGRKAVALLAGVGEQMTHKRQIAMDELGVLRNHLDSIKAIVARQQSLAKQGAVMEPIAPDALVVELREHIERSLGRRGITFTTEISPDCPVFMCDRSAVVQIAVNLLKNAKDAVHMQGSPGGGVHLNLEARGDHIVLSVTDTGVGMDADTLGNLFQHGFTTKPMGHGFGLHGSVLQARGLGGDIVADSDGPGRGATFTVTLPLKRVETRR